MNTREYDPTRPLPSLEQRAFEKHLSVESLYMPAGDYEQSNNSILRRNAIHFICKLQNYTAQKFDAFIPYLAMNYFDRFISRNPLPVVNVNDVEGDLNLLALCCLSLSWKMRNNSFSFHYYLTDRNDLGIDKNQVLKVELKILNALDWRMHAVTAFSFVHYFFSKIPRCSFKRKTVHEIIVQAQGDIKFTKFKPSIIAASALLAAVFPHLHHDKHREFENQLVERVKSNSMVIHQCMKMLIEMCDEKAIEMKRAEKELMEQPGGATEKGSTELSSSSSSSHRSVKDPMQEGSGIQEVQPSREDLPVRRRHGKAPIQKVSETQKTPKSEENAPLMNFKLKWVTDENEDLTFNPSVFRTMTASPPTEHEETAVETILRMFLPCCPH